MFITVTFWFLENRFWTIIDWRCSSWKTGPLLVGYNGWLPWASLFFLNSVYFLDTITFFGVRFKKLPAKWLFCASAEMV